MFKNYCKITLRNIRRQPVHATLNLSCLSIGIAGTLIILLYLHFELTYDRYHARSGRIYRVATHSIKTHEKTMDVAWASTPAPLGPTVEKDIAGVEDYTRLFQFWTSGEVMIGYNDIALEEKDVYAADPSVFNIFSFNFVSGDPARALLGPDKIVLSESLAKRVFGNEDAMGKILKITLPHSDPAIPPEHSVIVTGVYRDMPGNVHLYADALLSSQTDRALETYYFNQFNVHTYLLLHAQTDPETVGTRLTGIYTKYLDPARDPVLVSAGHKLVPVTQIHIESTGGFTYIYIFSAVGLLLLLISGISYVNLATAQANRRSLEIGLRKIMGSQRRQLISQFLGESVVMTLLAGLVAVGFVAAGINALNNMLDLDLSLRQLGEPQLILGIIAIVLLMGIVGGSYPAFFLASVEPVKAMKDRIVRKAPLRKILVSVQLAVVIFVLVSTGMIYDQLQYLRSKDLGFDKSHVISLTLPGQIQDASRYPVLKNTLLQSALIRNTGTSDFVPGTGDMVRRPIAIDGSPGQEQKFVYSGRFDYDFLSTMDIQIVSGRNFSQEFPGDTAAVIVNEALVKAFELKEPLGDKLRLGGKGNPKFFVIIGVIGDFHQSTLYTPIEPQMYRLGSNNKLFVRIGNNTPDALRHVETTWTSICRDFPLAYRFMDDTLEDGYKGDRIRGRVFLLLSLLTVFIAFLGLFGLASYLANQRIKEMGIRKILGATLKDTVYLMTGDFLLLVLIASIPAFILSWYVVDRWLENFAFRTGINYTLFVFSLAFTLLLTLIATGIHAWKAASINPLKNLRHE